MLVCIVFLSASCNDKPVQFKNKKRIMVGACFINIGYPDGWTVEKPNESSIHIFNNKKVESGQRIDFWIENTENYHKDIERNAWGYKEIKKDNITYKFAMIEFFWSRDKYISRTYGIINKLGITLYELKFAYLPNQDDIPDMLRDVFLGIVIE